MVLSFPIHLKPSPCSIQCLQWLRYSNSSLVYLISTLEVGVAEESITCRSTASVWRDLDLHFPPKPLSLSLSLSYGKIMPDTWPVWLSMDGSAWYMPCQLAVRFAKKVRLNRLIKALIGISPLMGKEQHSEDPVGHP